MIFYCYFTAGSDYAAVQQILFFLPGVSSLEVQVLIIADAISEEIESFSLRLTTPGPLLGGQLDPSTAQVFIYDGKFITLFSIKYCMLLYVTYIYIRIMSLPLHIQTLLQENLLHAMIFIGCWCCYTFIGLQ